MERKTLWPPTQIDLGLEKRFGHRLKLPEPEKRYGHRLKLSWGLKSVLVTDFLFWSQKRYGRRLKLTCDLESVLVTDSIELGPEKRFGHRLFFWSEKRYGQRFKLT